MEFFIVVLVKSCLYMILASGFIVIYKASRVLNLAHGEAVLLPGYFLLLGSKLISGSPLILVFILLAGSFVFGLIIYHAIIKPIAGQPPIVAVMVTLALGYIFRAVAIVVGHGQMGTYSLGWDRVYTLPWVGHLAGTQIIVIVGVVLVLVGLSIFYQFSRIGQQMRATAENPLLAAQRGINIHFVMGLAWGIGILTACAAAVIMASNYVVTLEMGGVGIKMFCVALVGGMNSLTGMIPASFLIALVETVAITYANPRVGEVVPFVLMLLILITRPWGFLGTQEEFERV